MKTFLVLILAVILNQAKAQHNLEISGKAKISLMENNNSDSVVVWMSDGTLGIRNSQSLVEHQVISISNDTIFLSDGGFIKLPFNGSWENLVGIPPQVGHDRYSDQEAVNAVTK